MFADLCDSTARIAKADPEEAQNYIDRALRTMADAVDTYGGSVRRVQGDGVIGVFGAPIAQEDHALRACLAALAIQRRTLQALEQPGESPIRVRIGIHSGEVVLGSINDLLSAHQRMDGAPIHLGARLEAMAPPGGVLLTSATVRLLDAELDTRPLGPRTFRGFDQPLEVHELVLDSLRSAAGPLARRRDLSPMIGRRQTLAALRTAAERASKGRLRVLGLRGDAGIGKTRVVRQFCSEAPGLGFEISSMITRSYTNHLPYSALADLMRALMGLREDIDPQREREAARAAVAAWNAAGQCHADAVGELLDLGLAQPAWQALSPRQRNARIGDAFMWLIAERLRRGPLAIVVEDLFLADRDSQRMLESLWHKLEALPVLLCLSYRQDFAHRWADAPWFEEHLLGPLDPVEAKQMLGNLLGCDASLEPVIHTLIERADGNPFFLEQMSLTLVDSGSLIGSPGDYRYMGQNSEPPFTASVAAVICARVDRLSPNAKASLEAVAILNETVTAEILGAMLGIAAEAAAKNLRMCASAGLLTAISQTPGRAAEENPDLANEPYAFRHALVQEVVVATLTRPRRVLLHRAALVALRAWLGERAAARVSVLAHHAYLGELWVDAAQLCLTSMARSISRSANRDALETLKRGLDAARRIEDSATMLPLELALRSEALGALMPQGDFDGMFTHLERAQVVTRMLGDPRRQAAVGLQLAVLLWTRGKYQQSLDATIQAAAAAVAAGSRGAQMTAAQARLMLDHALGRYDSLVEQARRVETSFAVELSSRRIMPGWAILPSVNVKVFLADALGRMGDTVTAQQVCEQGYRELSEPEHAFSRSMVDFVQGGIWVRSGRYRDAIACLRQAIVFCKLHDIPTMAPCMVGLLAEALGRDGGSAEAIDLVERAIADKTYLFAGLYTEYYLRYGKGVALTQCGRHEEALAELNLARAHAVAYGQRGHEADALLALGEAAAAAGQIEQARSLLQAAETAATECSMQGVLAQARHLAAKLVPHGAPTDG